MPPLRNHMHEQLASLTPILLVLFCQFWVFTTLPSEGAVTCRGGRPPPRPLVLVQDADSFMLKKFQIQQTVHRKNKKNANYTNPPYHLILLLFNLISISWFSGYCAMMRIVKTEVRTQVIDTTNIISIILYWRSQY